jgi:hypothetical protein
MHETSQTAWMHLRPTATRGQTHPRLLFVGPWGLTPTLLHLQPRQDSYGP